MRDVEHKWETRREKVGDKLDHIETKNLLDKWETSGRRVGDILDHAARWNRNPLDWRQLGKKCEMGFQSPSNTPGDKYDKWERLEVKLEQDRPFSGRQPTKEAGNEAPEWETSGRVEKRIMVRIFWRRGRNGRQMETKRCKEYKGRQERNMDKIMMEQIFFFAELRTPRSR